MNITKNDLNSLVSNIVYEGVKLKNFLIDNKVVGFDEVKSNYLNLVKTAIITSEENMNKSHDQLKEAVRIDNGAELATVRAIIPYATIREDLFSKYDIASSLLCIDGMVRGAENGEMTKYNDFLKFTNFVRSEAFSGLPLTSSEIYGETVEMENGKIINTPYEAKMVQSVLEETFTNTMDLEVIVNSFSKSLKYLQENKSIPNYLFITALAVDYMSYVLIAYICRLYRIATYFDNYFKPAERMVAESTYITTCSEQPVPKSSRLSDEKLMELRYPEELLDNAEGLLNSMDMLAIKDMSNLEKIESCIWKFIQKISGTEEELSDAIKDNRKISYTDFIKMELPKTIEIFSNKDFTDDFAFIFDDTFFYNDGSRGEELMHYKRVFGKCYGASSIINKEEGKIESPFGDLLQHINCVCEPNLSKSQYIAIAKDLFRVLVYFDRALREAFHRHRPWEVEGKYSGYHAIGSDRNREIIAAICAQAYSDFMIAITDQYKKIELAICKLSNEAQDWAEKNTKLADISVMAKVEVGREPIFSESVNMEEIQAICEEMEYQELSTYDRILKKSPIFENHPYYMEATGSATIVNKIGALLTTIINTVTTFFTKSFKPATDWVIKYSKELREIRFDSTDKMENVLEYNINFKSGSINGIGDITAMSKALKSFDLNEVQKDPDKFIRSLYPSEEVYKLFNSNNQKAQDIYSNAILFNDPLTGFREHQGSTISGSELQKTFQRWVSDIAGANGSDNAAVISKMLSDNLLDIKRSMESIKGKLVTDTVKPTVSSTNTKDEAQATSDQSDKEINNASVTIDNKAAEEGSFNIQMIYTVLNQTIIPIQNNIIHVYRTEYGYIRKIYIALKAATNNN